MTDWWDAPAQAAFTPPRLAIIDGEAAKPAARKIGENRTSDFRPAKPEAGSIPLSDAWAVGFWAEHPEWGPQLADVAVMTWQELKRRGWGNQDSAGRLELPLAQIGANLEAEPPNASRNFLPTTHKVWDWFSNNHPLQDYPAAARAFARIGGLGWLNSMARWAEGG